jgi:hypothetical protein
MCYALFLPETEADLERIGQLLLIHSWAVRHTHSGEGNQPTSLASSDGAPHSMVNIISTIFPVPLLIFSPSLEVSISRGRIAYIAEHEVGRSCTLEHLTLGQTRSTLRSPPLRSSQVSDLAIGGCTVWQAHQGCWGLPSLVHRHSPRSAYYRRSQPAMPWYSDRRENEKRSADAETAGQMRIVQSSRSAAGHVQMQGHACL